MKILIADDDDLSRRILERALQAQGHEVVVTSSGEEAWEKFDHEPVRLVVSDWLMPKLNGLELCKKVRAREDTSYAYFILLSTQETIPENYRLAMEAGVDDFLMKPLERPILRLRLRVAQRILRDSTEINELKELIPVCTCCQKMRNDEGYWNKLEAYLKDHTVSNTSHSMCPTCYNNSLLGNKKMLQI